jgi:formylglycine-generating enzyme required for sulfatase activity
MPFVPGGTLRARIDRGPLPVEEARLLGIALAQALGRAHIEGIVHRDLKPDNILFTADGRPLVADLGLAKHYRKDVSGASQSVALSKAGDFRGTFRYAPPEQIDDAASVGPTADVFALGVVLFECLAGKRPYEGSTNLEVVGRMALGNRPRLGELVPHVPGSLERAIDKALAVEPGARYPHGEAFARALQKGGEGSDASGIAFVQPGAPAASGGKLPLLAGALVLVAAAAGLGVWHLVSASPAPAPAAVGPPPTVRFEAPLDGAVVLAGEPTNVRGRVTGDVRSVFVQGVELPVAKETFEGAVPLDTDEIEVSAKDASGRRAGAKIAVKRKGAPDWYRALPPGSRPRFPLPAHLDFRREPGEYVNAKDQSVLVYVAPGISQMGGFARSGLEPLRDQLPVHQVELKGFWIGKYEVTVKEFELFETKTGFARSRNETIAGTKKAVKNEFGIVIDTTARDSSEDSLPIAQISWTDAHAYVQWAELELPTEAQWEKAAAWDPVAKRARLFPWGDEILGPGSKLTANVGDECVRELWRRTGEPVLSFFEGYRDGYEMFSPVGKFPLDRSPYGALDMGGNVSEWCLDSGIGAHPAPYSAGLVRDPCQRPVDDKDRGKVLRGGNWMSEPAGARATWRNVHRDDATHTSIGFRAALTEK